MNSDAIFNDLLFESPEEQAFFQQMTADLPQAEVDKLRSVLGKPSQFVGRVMTYDQAVAHWQAWDAWELEEKEKKRKEKEKKEEDEERKRKASIELAAARQKWHDTVEAARLDAVAWTEWQRKTIAEVRRQYKEAEDRRDKLVRDAREEFRRARDC